MEARDIKKLYYSISEVSEITGLKQYVLRYWETEFGELRPNKNRAGNRTYRSNDVDLILRIKTLLYERKFTIKGAKQHLKSSSVNNINVSEPRVVKLVQAIDVESLLKLKDDLNELVLILKTYKD